MHNICRLRSRWALPMRWSQLCSARCVQGRPAYVSAAHRCALCGLGVRSGVCGLAAATPVAREVHSQRSPRQIRRAAVARRGGEPVLLRSREFVWCAGRPPSTVLCSCRMARALVALSGDRRQGLLPCRTTAVRHVKGSWRTVAARRLPICRETHILLAPRLHGAPRLLGNLLAVLVFGMTVRLGAQPST